MTDFQQIYSDLEDFIEILTKDGLGESIRERYLDRANPGRDVILTMTLFEFHFKDAMKQNKLVDLQRKFIHILHEQLGGNLKFHTMLSWYKEETHSEIREKLYDLILTYYVELRKLDD